MKVENLVDFVVKNNQEEVYKSAIENKEYVLSAEFFNILKNDMLEEAFFEVKCDLVKFVECGGSANSKKMLSREVNDGFWVYSFTCSADFHQFEWFPTKELAMEAFNSLELGWFLVKKILIDSKKGIIHFEKLGGC